MKLRKIKYIISLALVLSSLSAVSVYASPTGSESAKVDSRIGESIIIDKSKTHGGSTLLPEDVLKSISKPTSKGVGFSSPDTPVTINKGSIKIELPDTSGKLDKGNVKFSVSKVAKVVNGGYEVLSDYKSSGVDLNTLKNANDLEIAASILSKVSTTGTTVVSDINGLCVIKDLDVGVYLVTATDIAKYENITPFMVSIPVWNESSKTMSFDTKVIPKHTPLPVIKLPKYRAPNTGYNGGELFGALSAISLIGGTSALTLRKRK